MAKEVRVDGGASDWYKEAIFILKEGVGESRTPDNLVTYADELLERQMKLGAAQKERCTAPRQSKGKKPIGHQKTHKGTYPADTTWIDTFLWLSIGLFVLVCVIYFAL